MGYINLNKKSFFNNAHYYTKLLGDKKKICIALKDNAYGHGIEPMGELALEYGIKHTMVRNVNEANRAVKYNFESILVLYELPTEIYPDNYIFSLNSLDDIKNCLPNYKIELKIDTGMGRNGILPSEIEDAIKLIKENNLILNGVFTHFACADENDEITYKQEKLFLKSVKKIKTLVDKPFRIHCANSAGAHKVDNNLYDMARVGIGLYGYLDFEDVANKVLPVLSLHAKKISTRVLKKGDTLNYGAIYRVPYDNFVVSNYDVGYGDGFFRLNERKKAHIANNKEILGRVSMDGLSVEGNDETICIFNNARALAKTHDTIHYEILTNLHAGVPKYIV
ncbi:MAG: alanine racemase [Arcobacteraceae bacterium]